MKTLLLQIIIILVAGYAHADNHWIKRADFGGAGRHRATSLCIGNKGYMGLGHLNGTGTEYYYSDWWEYDPATNAWTQKADYIGNNGNGELGARGVGLETVCFVGLGEVDHYSFYKYDAVTNQWTQVSSAPGGNLFQDTQDMIIGHKAYFTDLYDDELYEYDCDTDQWTFKGTLPFPWYFVFSGFTIDNLIYVKAYDELWVYDPSQNSWTFKNYFPGTAALASNCVVQHGKAYIINGHIETDHTVVTSEVWQYDPVTEQWSQFGDFPGTARRYSSSITIGDRCYIGTGTNGTNFNDFWEFNSIAGQDELNTPEFAVGPVPATDHVTIQSEQLHSFTVSLTDLSGKVTGMYRTDNGSVTIQKGNLSAGHYFYSVQSENRVLQSGKCIFN